MSPARTVAESAVATGGWRTSGDGRGTTVTSPVDVPRALATRYVNVMGPLSPPLSTTRTWLKSSTATVMGEASPSAPLRPSTPWTTSRPPAGSVSLPSTLTSTSPPAGSSAVSRTATGKPPSSPSGNTSTRISPGAESNSLAATYSR